MAILHGTRAFTFLIAALFAGLMLASTTGCSGDIEQSPTPPVSGQDDISERLDRIEKALTQIQADIERQTHLPTPTSALQQRQTPQAPTTTPAASPTAPAATGTAVPDPTPTFTVQGPGICGRSPEIQETILERLGTSLCQATTLPELFRITDEFRLEMDRVRAGDFLGLVNVRRLEVSANGVEPGGFLGLLNLEQLELGLSSSTGVTTESFLGLESLESMTLEISSPDREDPQVAPLPPFPNLPSLKHLRAMGIHNPENDQLPGTLFKELPALESVEMSVHYIGTVNDWGGDFQIPPDLFLGNPNLKEVSYSKRSGPEEMTLLVPITLFALNPLMEIISIQDSVTRIPNNMFMHLQKLEALSLSERYTSEGWVRHEIILSKLSPLYNKITYGNEYPSGYDLEDKEN